MPSRTSLVAFLTIVVLLAAACSAPKDATNPAAPPATAAAPQYAYAQTNDLRVAGQLTKGWYQVEDGAWRWMLASQSPKTRW